MTIQEFHINFDIELDKTLDFEYPYIQPEQKDYWLNKAQDVVVKLKYDPQSPNNKGFEENQIRIDDLKEIVKKSGTITPTVSGTVYTSALPNDYLHLIRHRCITNTASCGNKTVGGKIVEQDDINTLLLNPFRKPIQEEPLYYIDSTGIVYETEGRFTVTGTILNYLKVPARMRYGTAYSTPTTDVQCEFTSTIMQHEILNMAISMVLENIESQRYQTNLNELTKQNN